MSECLALLESNSEELTTALPPSSLLNQKQRRLHPGASAGLTSSPKPSATRSMISEPAFSPVLRGSLYAGKADSAAGKKARGLLGIRL